MKKWLKIAIPSIVIIGIIVSFFIYVIFFSVIRDGFPTNGTMNAEQTGNNEITFTIIGDVWNYYSDPVKFSECAYSMWVGDNCLSSEEYVFREFNDERWTDMNFTKVHGSGASNANYHEDGDTIYMVYFNDLDNGGYLSDNDTITIKSSDPLQSNIMYRVFLATDIHGDDGHGNYVGTLYGPQRSGW